MNEGVFHFKVGTIDCSAVSDGTYQFTDPAHDLFPTAPPELLAQALLAYDIRLEQWKEWVSPFICLVIRTSEHCLLVDTGLGRVDYAPHAGKLLQNLDRAGIAPGDIDTLILTHGHTDHLGGLTDPSGEAVFRNAGYYITRQEWEFWYSQAGLAYAETEALHARRQLTPLEDRLELIDGESEIVPGVHAIPAPGHSPGHMALSVVSGGEQLLVAGDAFAHPLHLQQPDWSMTYDYQPDLAIRSRRELLERAEAAHTRLLAYHFDFPGLGTVYRYDGELKWQPVTVLV